MKYVIICEKPSAAKNFAKALGGRTGVFDGKEYEIVALAGHVMTYKDPVDMVSNDLKDKYKAWSLDTLPWNINELSFERKVAPKKGDLLANVKSIVRTADALVAACDVDPSGEGGLIAGEVAKEIGWSGPYYRMYFIDESVKQIQKAFKSMQAISLATDTEILKAETRARWDFCSMQITRCSTVLAHEVGIKAVLRNGRLKSVMNKIVFEQEEAIRNYKKKPYYEIQFKDNNGHVYKRKFNDGDDWRYADKSAVPLDDYHESAVVQDSKVQKHSAPGKLLDLMGLTALLAPKGFKAKDVLASYQKGYDAGYLSYPRTEDKVISHEQFNDMLPLIDSIAQVVGIDSAKLTHRTPRKTHVKDGGSHGANRPGMKVPQTLSELDKFDVGAEKGITQAIYQTLAKNFLAMFGEDYIYDSVTGHVIDYPDFKTQFSVPVDLGYRAIFFDDDKDGDDDSEENVMAGIGSTSSPFIKEGVNPKPKTPTIKWLCSQLEHYEVGTGATRTSTVAELTSSAVDKRLMEEKRGKLSTSVLGKINAVFLKGTYIGDPSVTAQLFEQMEDVGNHKREMNEVVNTVTTVVRHDKETMSANKTLVKQYIEQVINNGGKEAKALSKIKAKPKAQKIRLDFKGQSIELYNLLFGVRPATDDELTKLANGETIIFEGKSKTGKPFKAKVGIAKDPKYGWGFKLIEFVSDGPAKVKGMYKGHEIEFKPSFGSYVFDKVEQNRLLSGEQFVIQTQTKAGKSWTPMVELHNDPKYGWCVHAVFAKKPKPTSIDDMKDTWSGHTFTNEEKDVMLSGGAVAVKTKKGSQAMVKFGKTKYNGHEYYGYYVDSWL